jgi:tripartite-type tricarboxylate transporter receptor subunit TctC
MNVHGGLPYKNVAEFLSAAKAQPGKFTFAYSSATTRLAGELFQQQAGVQLTSVPYKSTGAGLTDVAGGQVDLFFIDPVSAGVYYPNGRIRPLLVSGPKRLQTLAEVPSAAEAGIPGYEMYPWFGVYMPAKAPPAAINQLRNAVVQALKAPSMVATLEKAGLEPFALCGEELTKYQMSDIERMGQVIRKAKLLPQ